jgi:transcriptional regulator with XRE-family HTH domain
MTGSTVVCNNLAMPNQHTRQGRRGPEVSADRIRECRARAKVTQLTVAARAGLNKDSVSRIESGHTRWPALETTMAIAEALGVEYRSLLADAAKLG